MSHLRRGLTVVAIVLIASAVVSGAIAQDPPADTTPPVVTVPSSPVTAEATSASGAVVSFSASAVDDVDGPVAVNCTPASGSTFPIGSTGVSCSAQDVAGNTGSADFQVVVSDTQAPTVIVPGNITTAATSASGAVVSFSASATDTVDGPRAVTCNPASGLTFPIGATPVTCSAQDVAGNTGSAGFTVTVGDTQPPTVTVPANITTSATSAAGAVVTFSASASDAVDGARPVNCSPASGSTFPIGGTTVTCSAQDAAGNTGSSSFTVTVTDSQPPTVTVPANITTAATGAAGAVVTFSASANDAIDGPRAVSCSPGSGLMFPIGPTTVTCTAQDLSGNTGSASFTVTVTDTQPPTVTVPANITTPATSAAGAVVTFSASASDTVDGPRPVTCNPASGATFPITSTTVTCSAQDVAGNAGSATFQVTVADTQAPTVTVPSPISVVATSAAGAAVTYSASANDAIDGPRPVTCTPASGSTFPIGSNTVNCSASDAHGNSASTPFTVTVTDGAPTVTVPPTQTAEANGDWGAHVTYAPAPVGSDVVDGALLVTCNKPSGSVFPLGQTTVTCAATDSKGSSATGSFQVNVVDTTPPIVTAPPEATFVAEGSSLPRSFPALAAYLARGRAADLVDPIPWLVVEAPDFFPLGTTVVTYIAVDASGNRDSATTTITIVPPPPPGQRPPTPPPDDPPPGNVTALRANPGNALVRLSWTAPRDDDVVRYAAFRSERTGPVVQVYSGAARSFVNRGLANGVEYRYVVVAYDRGGNRSVGVAVLATPRLPMLLAPRDGARLAKGTTFSWRRVAGARYYNFQLFRVRAAGRVKILSAWPATNRFRLRATWRFEGRRHRLTAGTYRWFVWPGFAPSRYGELLGERSFTVTRRRG